jgi:hypothetical protein
MKRDPNHPFAELFPERFPDPIWNAHAEQLNNQIKQLFDSGKLLDAYILVFKSSIEYFSKPRKPGNLDFRRWLIQEEFLQLTAIHDDIRYIYGLSLVYYAEPTLDFLIGIVSDLTNLKDECYHPLSDAERLYLRQIIVSDMSPELYKRFLGDQDDVKQSNQEISTIN